ncbi:MAG TPA: PKD domain-containing protein [Bacteroidales bacterium]|jgi:PKD repeat protein|nr:PKD domain-containing protein [Bacteroidales bacterium]HQH22695.1 PKD domain-containing protein [Bacteroidales bacterium]HQJ82078.1 PKD domain-containing protein [Bacteroidales bacterium]
MKNKQLILVLLAVLFHQISVGQTDTYTIKRTVFSSDFYDEFAPVFYQNGLVFVTNRSSGVTDYSTSQDANFTKIFFIDTDGKKTRPRLFSKYLRTRLNDGPATFNASGDTVYFSNNLITEGNLRKISSMRNKLGIFYAVREGKKWTKIREMRFNNEWYNISTPCLSPDGNRLYFASDKPDGFGGTDIYYSERKGEYWSDPVNLGPVINTAGNESYPFVTAEGELYFSSDGHPGLGGKDIFFSAMKEGRWQTPVRLDPPVNSQHDDFALITDPMGRGGYFTTNRDNSLDIYEFSTVSSQIFYAGLQKDNQYCFTFSDPGTIEIDTLFLKYVWDFGDGIKAEGAEAGHCFPGPGKYNVRLDIADKKNGNLFFTKLMLEIDLRDVEQPYITSPDALTSGETVEFDALKSYLPGFDIADWTWDFGDGTRGEGESIKHSYDKPGEYTVKLGLKLKSQPKGSIYNDGISKKVHVFGSQAERNNWMAARIPDKSEYTDFRLSSGLSVNTLYSAQNESSKDVVYRIDLLSSSERIGTGSSVFKNISSKYTVREESNPSTGGWLYYVSDEHLDLMSAYPAWSELNGAGFRDARVIIQVITDPVRKELISLLKNYGISDEFYFDSYNRLRANAYLMLDQIVMLLNRNPSLRLEIGVHTDNAGTAAANLKLSQTRAQVMVNYLVNRGIEGRRVVARGFGNTKPVSRGTSEADRKLNRRIELNVIN